MRIHRFQARCAVVYFTTFTVIIVVRRFIVDVAIEFVFVCHVSVVNIRERREKVSRFSDFGIKERCVRCEEEKVASRAGGKRVKGKKKD